MKNIDLFSAAGVECNRVNIGERTDLLGDPKIKQEKPHTIIGFPGGDVEIARTSEGLYWVHIAVRRPHKDPQQDAGKIVGARIDFVGRYGDEANRILREEIAAGDVEHIAFLVSPADSN